MAGASDKARFYLEQSVPELQEFVRKKIFTKEEVASIARKRSAFEHKLNARGSTPLDYARYVAFEMNLDSLRQTRSKRMGVKSAGHTGQRRLFFILDRATKKFHGDTALWLQYVTFARKQKAHKRVAQIITNMLRLHPTSPELWTYAADYALEERGDVTEARSHMQRGLRFCRESKFLWSEYLKLEMIYIAKIMNRQHILGLGSVSSDTAQLPGDEAINSDMMLLSPLTSTDMSVAHRKTESPPEKDSKIGVVPNPALSGAIPIAVFDSAIKHFPNDPAFGARMFDVVAGFHRLQCTRRILRHIVEILMKSAPNDAACVSRFIVEPIIGADALSVGFPSALIAVLDRFESLIKDLEASHSSLEQSSAYASVSQHLIQRIIPFLDCPELDPEIRGVVISMIKNGWNQFSPYFEKQAEDNAVDMVTLLEDLLNHGFQELVSSGVDMAVRMWPDEPRIHALKTLIV
ncbi:MAG: hypothetical protein Q9219_001508 [cf. Caloplaca sp. 3 TL-2023]